MEKYRGLKINTLNLNDKLYFIKIIRYLQRKEYT